jgi:hypothetical protein
MLSNSLTHLLVEARVEDLHRASRNSGRTRRVSATAGEDSRSARAPFATRVSRTITRVFIGGRSAADEAAAIHSFDVQWARFFDFGAGRLPRFLTRLARDFSVAHRADLAVSHAER